MIGSELFLLVVIYSSVTIGQQITGTESREPAFLLRPRNFNPHPYETTRNLLYSKNYLYPLPQLPQLPQFEQYQDLVSSIQALPSSADRNPYNIIKEQRDYVNQRYGQEDQRVYSALANHAQRILQPKQQPLVPRKYSFAYSANNIYHAQESDQGLVKGSYEVPLPDGRIQLVKYTADDQGYHPEISYKGEFDPNAVATATTPRPLPPIALYAPSAQSQQRSVVVYPDEEEEEQPELEQEAPKSYYSSTTISDTPNAVQYDNYRLISGLQRPYGTVKTVPQKNPAKYGLIQYATYEEVADVAP